MSFMYCRHREIMDSKLIVEAARVAQSGEHGIYNSLTMDPLIHGVGSVIDH